MRLYGEPLGGVYVKLLSPERSSRRQVLIKASTGLPLRPEPDTRLHVQSSAPPLVKMHAYSSMLPVRNHTVLKEKFSANVLFSAHGKRTNGNAYFSFMVQPRSAGQSVRSNEHAYKAGGACNKYLDSSRICPQQEPF